MERNSVKRTALLQCLRSTKSHPGAEWIWTRLRGEYPSLSLATVYRNLNRLREAGVIRCVGTVAGEERYDADLSEHMHAVCTVCGCVSDVQTVAVPQALVGMAEDETGFTVSFANLQFHGVCRECKEKIKKGEEKHENVQM